MPFYNVIVGLGVEYETYIEAESEEEAKAIALDNAERNGAFTFTGFVSYSEPEVKDVWELDETADPDACKMARGS